MKSRVHFLLGLYSHKSRSIRFCSQSRFSDLCLKTALAGLLQCLPFARIRPFRLCTGMTITGHSMTSASVSDSHLVLDLYHVSLNSTFRLRLAPKKLHRAWIIPQTLPNGSVCVIALFHSCWESLVYTVLISRPIECFTNNVFDVKIDFSDSRFHQFILTVLLLRLISWGRNRWISSFHSARN